MRSYEIHIDGTPICSTFGLMFDSFEQEEPEELVNYVDVPGRDGPLDLTEALTGGPVYGSRTFDFNLSVLGDPSGFAAKMTAIRSLILGKRLPFRLSWESGYEYRGRFGIASTVSELLAGTFAVHVTAEPYKRKPDHTYKVRAGGGATVDLPSGRMRVSPVFECSRPTVIACNGLSETLPVGAHKVRGLYLSEGENRMYLNSTPDLTPSKWEDYAADTWGDHSGMTWAEVAWRGHERPTGDEYDVFITYEWGDL